MERLCKLIWFTLCFFCISLCYSQDRKQIDDYFLSKNDAYSQFKEYIYVNNKYYVLFLHSNVSNNNKNYYYVIHQSDINTYFYDFSTVYESDYSGNMDKYCLKFKNIDFTIADFTYDGKLNCLRTCYSEMQGENSFLISNFDDDLSGNYFCLVFPSYLYLNKQIKRINKDVYISFKDLSFCILNGKRGIRVLSMGNEKYNNFGEEYLISIDEKTSSHYSFFYWSPTEQRYILDETVTQEQLKNAYCPEEYFAYNGLDFSKLDKCLNQSDIKDLTPAQLRLMRNAIYARHGRTFKSVDLQSLWECYTWYKKNPNYSDSLLTDIDKYNIELIQKYESK